MKEQHIKQVFQQTLLGVLIISLFASVSFAQETEKQTYRPTGIHADLAASAVILEFEDNNDGSCDDMCWDLPPVLPGKFNFTVGYQINPYISMDARVWDFWLVLMGAEVGPTIHFTNTRVSPYITGGVGTILTFEVVPYLFAAGGLDLYVSEHAGFFAEAKYYRSSHSNEGIILPEFGFKWRF